MIIQREMDILVLKEGGKKLAAILDGLVQEIHPGIRTKYLDALAERLILEAGGRPSFKNYRSRGTQMPYPAALCVSVNDEVVHGLPGERVLEEGDIVGLDIGMEYKKFFTDTAITVPVGKIPKEVKNLLEVTRNALSIGIENARVGGHVGDIGEAIEKYVKIKGVGVVRELVGHGVGRAVHEDPEIPNWGRRGEGRELVEGMVIAIEPMVTLGSPRLKVSPDGWTWSTIDGKAAAHFEHTLLLTRKGPEIITQR